VLGRIGDFRNVHLIDGSVLPSVPSTTFTLTVMANAHRIVSESRYV
jgi:choline dehydrogenase-like flavoprotein